MVIDFLLLLLLLLLFFRPVSVVFPFLSCSLLLLLLLLSFPFYSPFIQTMEFPNVGKQCEVKECRQLDYLFFVCSGCNKVVCDQHHPPANHSCPNPPIKDERVVCCPLCDAPLPGRKDDDPNIRVRRDHVFLTPDESGLPSPPVFPLPSFM